MTLQTRFCCDLAKAWMKWEELRQLFLFLCSLSNLIFHSDSFVIFLLQLRLIWLVLVH